MRGLETEYCMLVKCNNVKFSVDAKLTVLCCRIPALRNCDKIAGSLEDEDYELGELRDPQHNDVILCDVTNDSNQHETGVQIYQVGIFVSKLLNQELRVVSGLCNNAD